MNGLLFSPLLLLGAAALQAEAVKPAAPPTPRFVDATEESGIDYRNVCGAEPGEKGWLTEGMGAGAAWLDYDGDGHLDLYVVNGSTYEREPGRGEPNRLFRGDGRGRFSDVTDAAGVGHRGWGYGVAVGDVDNDGDADLFLANLGANSLLLNRGDGTFRDATARSGLTGEEWSTSAAFFDIEGDGDLDLYVGNYMVGDPDVVPRRGTDAARGASCTYRGIPVACGPLGQQAVQDQVFRNDGKGRFTEVTRGAGVRLDRPRFTLGVVAGDYDNDGDTDLYVANDSVSNSLWENDGNGKFRDVGLEKLVALNVDGRAQAGMGTDFGDYDGDGWLDLVVTNFSYDTNTIYRNLGGTFFIDESAATGMNVTQFALSWGTAFYDLDNDGDEDLLIANGHIYPEVDAHDIGTTYRQTNHLFDNRGTRFVEVARSAGPGLAVRRSFRGAAFADYDADGDIDVFLTALSDKGLLLRNETASTHHYLEIRLEGRSANRDGVGTRVTVKLGNDRLLLRERKGGGSYLSASSPRLHFGLGQYDRVERIEVAWPGGAVQTLKDVAADRSILIRQPRRED